MSPETSPQGGAGNPVRPRHRALALGAGGGVVLLAAIDAYVVVSVLLQACLVTFAAGSVITAAALGALGAAQELGCALRALYGRRGGGAGGLAGVFWRGCSGATCR